MRRINSLPKNKPRTVSTEDVFISHQRRCGNTTRIVDKVIQDLFKGKLCRIADHHPTELAARFTFGVVLRRLTLEHTRVYEEALYINEQEMCMWLDFTHIEPPNEF